MTETELREKEVLIAALIARQNMDTFLGFTEKEKIKINKGLDETIKSGILSVYGEGEDLELILKMTAKVMQAVAQKEGILNSEGKKPSTSGMSGPKWD